MPKEFGKYGSAPTTEEAYEEGLARGRSWSAAWADHDELGGPWFIRSATGSSDPDWKAYCAQLVENNAAWRRG